MGKIRIDGGRIVLAVYVVFLAVVFALWKGDVLQRDCLLVDIAVSWQLLLLVLGIMRLFTKPRAIGIVLTFIGVFTMLPMFGTVMPALAEVMSDRRVWLVVPIVIGVVLVVSEVIAYRKRKGEMAVEIDADREGIVEVKALMGARNVIVGDGDLNGGYISAIFGSAEVDLRKCTLPGGLVEVEASVVMGNVVLKVPKDWTVDVNSSVAVGGVADRRKNKCEDGQKTLLLNASVTLGSIEIMND